MSDQPESAKAQPETAAQPINEAAIIAKAVEVARGETDKIVQASKAEVEATNKRMQAAVEALSGKPAKSQNTEALEAFVSNPMAFLNDIVEISTEKATKQIEAKQAAAQAVYNDRAEVIVPLVKEYPELQQQTKLNMVEALSESYISRGMSRKEALAKAAKETIEEFKLKPLSQLEEEAGYSNVGMPFGSSFPAGRVKRFDDSKSSSSFVEGLRQGANAIRKRNLKEQ